MFWIRGRRLWGARRPRSRIKTNWSRGVKVIVHHTAGAEPADSANRQYDYMRGLQNFHMDTRGWSDIAYNYVIMDDGGWERVYSGWERNPDGFGWRRKHVGWKLVPSTVIEGRGFNVVGAHAPGYNTHVGVAFAGNYTNESLHKGQVRALELLERNLKARGARLTGRKAHGDVYPTSCPGSAARRSLNL